MEGFYLRLPPGTTQYSKKNITMLFYGGKPANNLPFLWQLKHEVEKASEDLLLLDAYRKYGNYF